MSGKIQTIDKLPNFCNRFSESNVLSKTVCHKTTTVHPSIINHTAKKVSFTDSAKFLAVQGNEGLYFKDPHIFCLCQNKFSDRRWLIDHLERFHCRTIKIFCDLCTKIVFSRFAIIKHLKIHKKKSFECNICDYKTSFKGNLDNHKLKHAVKVECEICHKLVANMYKHKENHIMLKCSICCKIYSRASISYHMRTHRNRK